MIWENGISPRLRLHLLKKKSSSSKLIIKYDPGIHMTSIVFGIGKLVKQDIVSLWNKDRSFSSAGQK